MLHSEQLSASTELSNCFTSILIVQASLTVVQIQLQDIAIFLEANAFLIQSIVYRVFQLEQFVHYLNNAQYRGGSPVISELMFIF